MQPKDYLKNKARVFAKQTWAGPGKFGVFIFLCILIIATFESLGLSNRERNLELRTVNNIVIKKGQEKNILPQEHELDVSSFKEKLKVSAQIDKENRERMIENILLYGTLDQYVYENNFEIKQKNNRDYYNSVYLDIMLLSSGRLVREEDNELFIDI
jgi:hypothetical protein